ncbi:hypothetical protein T02_13823 [Trichinella nativa]|uniref:Uncharacterized protein n=1 Tax=Trichinella nativa TaxID=6335 RepID=A0A0V1KM99_9BILA|nr:hypothetical protein T02_13823 [Trichinella nativa]
MQKESLRCDLVFIANFANFVQAFTFLEKRSETLVDRLQVFDKVIDNIHKIPGIVGEDIKISLLQCLVTQWRWFAQEFFDIRELWNAFLIDRLTLLRSRKSYHISPKREQLIGTYKV